jgi:Zn-dependent protease/CBS domain-containing protein
MNPVNQVLRSLQRGSASIHVSYAWLAAFLVLSSLTGWYVADVLIVSPDTSHRVVLLLVLPLILSLFLLLHELGHRWYARQRKLTLPYSILYISGSFPHGYETPRTPGMEIRIALAGPAASLSLALVFLTPLYIVPANTPIGTALLVLGLLNVAIGGVNLLPAIPFDGGQILRAIFWYLHGNHFSGTRVAYLYGHLVAAGALGLGIYLLSWQPAHFVPGLWATMLAWMILRASHHELSRSNLIARAAAVPAADGIAGLNPTVRAAASVSEAVDILLEQQANGPGLVRDRDRFVGTITLDLIRGVPRSRWDSLEVQEVMLPLDRLTDSTPGAPLLDVLRMQRLHDRLPVIVRDDQGDVAGLVSSDIAPTVLLRRAEENSFSRVSPDTTREPPPRS